ncbi:ATP-dependent DNA ligase [Campylobacterota bacterium]|nr:ATP-dependent DNA ligase [Campylobacterota bacterium]
MNFKTPLLQAAIVAMIAAAPAFAHFGVVTTDKTSIEDDKESTLAITFAFLHPFEQTRMTMVKPEEAGFFANGKKTSLLASLTRKTKTDENAWYQASQKIKEPGVYQFYVNPAPYFEPAEGKFIRHQTKTIVEAFGAGEGWDAPIGLKAEIVPLTRPYSVLTGGIFSGKVLYKGKIAPNTSVEIEYYNEGSKLKAPNDALVTLQTTTDENGIFHAALPIEGWWGFAALIDDDETIKKDGKDYPVELGAVIWIKAQSYSAAKK